MPARLCALLFLTAISLPARADGPCGAAERGNTDAIAFLKQMFQSRRYECAVGFAKDYGLSISSLPGRDGIDTRFALREAATELVADAQHPAESRRALAKAAAWTAHSPHLLPAPAEEVHADVRMLLAMAENFFSAEYRKAGDLARQEEDITREGLANWLDVLLAAVALDLRLPDDRRALTVNDFKTGALSEAGRLRLYGPLVRLAAALREDKVLRGIRSELARSAYFHGSPWSKKAPRDLVVERCGQVLKLIELLSDLKDCDGRCVPIWYWKPTMNVASAYYRLDMREEADKTVQTSLALVRSIESANARLSEYRFAFTDLLVLKYDKAVLGPLVKEMWQMANALDTPIAKEVRKTLPETLKRWGRSDLLD
jgi:hypothetical protein